LLYGAAIFVGAGARMRARARTTAATTTRATSLFAGSPSHRARDNLAHVYSHPRASRTHVSSRAFTWIDCHARAWVLKKRRE